MSGHRKKLVWAGSFAICRKASAEMYRSDFTFRLLCTLSRFVCVARFGAQCSLFRLPMQYSVVLAPDPSCRSGECLRRSGNPSLSSTGRGNLSCQHSLDGLWLTWELFWKSEAGRFTGDLTFFLPIQLSLRTHGLFSHWTIFLRFPYCLLPAL